MKAHTRKHSSECEHESDEMHGKLIFNQSRLCNYINVKSKLLSNWNSKFLFRCGMVVFAL